MDFEEVSLSTAHIQIDKLLHNIDTFKQLLSNRTKFLAVIKANAYSHGAVPIAHEIEKVGAADYFGVAQLSEALELRTNGISTPILIFNSMRPDEIKYAIQHNLTMTVFSPRVAKNIVTEAEKLGTLAKVHLKIDSGMARLGVPSFDEALKVYNALASSYVNIEGIYTHFADAKDTSPDNFTREQFAHFKKILDQFAAEGIDFEIRHTCNTAGTINFPDYHLDMVRVGLGLYGLDPTNTSTVDLQPIETIRTIITNIKDFPAGKSVGYDRTYFSKEPIRIATAAIGYADGVAKSLSNKGYFTFNGKQLPILGEVCMDQVMVDCSKVPNLAIGDQITYFGDPAVGDLLVTEVAQTANASQYDLLCRIGNRMRRVYH